MASSLIETLRVQLQRCAEDLRERLKADSVTLLVYDDKSDCFDLPIAAGLRLPEFFADPAMLPGTDRVAGEIVKRRVSKIDIPIGKSAAISQAFAAREGVVAAAGFPLAANDRSLGVLFVSYRKAHRVNKEQVRIAEAAAEQAARAIFEADPFADLRALRESQPQVAEDRTLRATAKLITQVLDRPAAIWLPSPNGSDRNREYRVKAVSAVRQRYLTVGVAKPGDRSLISQTFDSPLPLPSEPLDFGQPPEGFAKVAADDLNAIAAGWETLQAFPIVLEGRCIGVVEVFGRRASPLGTESTRALDRLCQLAAEVIGSRSASIARSEDLVRIAGKISSAGAYSLALKELVRGARELTGADYSMIARHWPDLSRVTAEAVSGTVPGWMHTLAPVTDQFARDCLNSGDALLVADTERLPSVHATYIKDVRSMVALPIPGRNQVPTALLLVIGRRKDQFQDEELRLLKTLVTQVSTATLGASWLLDPSNELDQATERFLDLDPIFKEALTEITDEHRFHFASIQLIRPKRRTIETRVTHWAGEGDVDIGVSAHPLDVNTQVLDIQADIAKAWPPRIEVIGGWDDRFDPFAFKKWEHEKLVRVWVPMFVVRDCDGKLVRGVGDWQRFYRWAERPAERRERGWRAVYDLAERDPPHSSSYLPQILGTVDVGWLDPDAQFDLARVERLAALVAQKAIKIYDHLLPSALDTIARGAADLVNADAASVHYGYDRRQRRYAYEVCSGPDSLFTLHEFGPDHHSLGFSARSEERPVYALAATSERGIKLADLYPKLSSQGIAAVAAFPFKVDDADGVLYLYFRSQRRLSSDEESWVKSYCAKATQAIRHFTHRARDQDYERQLKRLHDVTLSLVRDPLKPDLLREVAGYARDLLAADVVVIYEYLPDQRRFSHEGHYVGRLLTPLDDIASTDAASPSMRLLAHGKDVYARDGKTDPMVGDPSPGGFLAREEIASVAAALLTLGKSIVGAMFVYYRTPQVFGLQSKNVVSILAASAARAIVNAGTYRRFVADLERSDRWMEALSELDAAIAESLHAPSFDVRGVFQFVLQTAANLTGAEAGYVMGYEPSGGGRLELKAELGVPAEHRQLAHGIDQGIVGQAAREKRSILAGDIRLEPHSTHYMEIVPGTRSELAVPIVARDGLIGVINLEHGSRGAFTESHRGLVEILAAQATIAVHSASLYHRLDRQIKPLRSLARMTPRIQEAGTREDLLLRLFLTGVTAEEGLAFSRAIVFLWNAKGALLGKLAVGAAGQDEADSIWSRLHDEKRALLGQSESASFDRLLEDATIAADAERDDPSRLCTLSAAVASMQLPVPGFGGKVEECVLRVGKASGPEATKPLLVCAATPDPLRDALAQALGQPCESASYDFAVMPLVGNSGFLGLLAVDNRFRFPAVEIDADALDRLEVYGREIALSVESSRAQIAAHKHRDRRKAEEVTTRVLSAIGSETKRLIEQIEEQSKAIDKGLKAVRRHCPKASADADRQLAQIDAAVDRIGTHIDAIRNKLRQRPPALPALSQDRWDLTEIAKVALTEQHKQIKRLGVEVDFPAPKTAVLVDGDYSILLDAVRRLIENALEAVEHCDVGQRRIGVKVSTMQFAGKERFAAIEIDNPCPGGISLLDKARVFQPGVSSKGSNRGLGLGRARVAIEMHGGWIAEIGRPNEARFLVCLPHS